MRLRDRPWGLLAGAILLTAAIVHVAVDLGDGTVTWRGRHISAAGHPLRFTLVALALPLGLGGAVLAWITVIDEWRRDYRPRWKPRFVDQERRAAPPASDDPLTSPRSDP